MVQALPSRLVLLSANGVAERPVPMNRGRLALGRSADNDVVLTDPQVSRHHAELRNETGRWVLRDLGSTAGTTHSGRRLERPVVLRHGDVIGLGPVHLRYEEDGGEPPTVIGPAVPAGVPHPRPAQPTVPPGRMDFGRIDGSGNDFVIGTQNNYHARESFLREVAATRTRARAFIWLGVVLVVAGIGMALFVVSGFFSDLGDAIGSEQITDPPQSPFGEEVGGVPLMVIAAGLEVAGVLMIVIGIVLHVTATARRRDVDRRYPVHPPVRHR